MLQKNEICSDEDIVLTVAELTEVLKTCAFDDDCRNCPLAKKYPDEVCQKGFKVKNKNGEDLNIWCYDMAMMLAAEALERYTDKNLEVSP